MWGLWLTPRNFQPHLHAKSFPQKRALHFLPVDAQDGKICELSVAVKVGDEVLNHIHWDDITNVFSILALNSRCRNEYLSAWLLSRLCYAQLTNTIC